MRFPNVIVVDMHSLSAQTKFSSYCGDGTCTGCTNADFKLTVIYRHSTPYRRLETMDQSTMSWHGLYQSLMQTAATAMIRLGTVSRGDRLGGHYVCGEFQQDPLLLHFLLYRERIERPDRCNGFQKDAISLRFHWIIIKTLQNRRHLP